MLEDEVSVILDLDNVAEKFTEADPCPALILAKVDPDQSACILFGRI